MIQLSVIHASRNRVFPISFHISFILLNSRHLLFYLAYTASPSTMRFCGFSSEAHAVKLMTAIKQHFKEEKARLDSIIEGKKCTETLISDYRLYNRIFDAADEERELREYFFSC